MNIIQSYTLPNSTSIKRLRETDFALETRDKICLYEDACTLVLFYTETPESKRILGVLKTVAETVAGPSFACCNVLLEKKVAEAFMEVSFIKEHPFHWATTRSFPLMLVYRKGYPVNFYDGPADVAILTNFAINIACLPEFHNRNISLTQRIRNEMWSEYTMKNPLVLNSMRQMEAQKQPYRIQSLPALPYKETKTILDNQD